MKGCHVFLAHVTTKKAEDKSEEKRLKDVPIVQDFPEVFPEDLSGIPTTRQVDFQIDLITGAAPVARAPYRLASSKMKELSDQLYLALGRHLEEIHMTWAHLEKKWTRLRTYTNISQDYVLSGWRRRHRLHVTPSQLLPRRRHKNPRRRQNARPNPLSKIFSFTMAS
ncbi:hypothetical protein Tco_0096314 [Tanacetum coccineum]